MTDSKTLLQLAARCRRMAGLCSTAAIARKFEALALDYEEHARQVDRRSAVKAGNGAESSVKINARVPADAVAPIGPPRAA